MMKLAFALLNWLQIYIVYQHNPGDEAAEETVHFFFTLLREDHNITSLQVKQDEENATYVIMYEQDGEEKQERIACEAAERLWKDITDELILFPSR